MPTYFTVDRRGSIQPGQVVHLERHSDVAPPFLQAFIDSQFPDGVSSHGTRYFVEGGAASTAVEPNIEVIWEAARRQVNPSAPSRAQAMFGWEALEDANWFRLRYGQPTSAIWEVEAPEGFRADPRWLTLKGSALMTWHAAACYWRGEAVDGYWSFLIGEGLRWEVLMPLPVVHLRSVG